MGRSFTLTLDVIARFDRMIDKSGGPDACWPRAGTKNAWGYNHLSISGAKIGSHVVAFVIANGPVTDGLLVRHTCDNPACCNPKHLSLGTHTENMADMDARGRRVNGMARLKKSDIPQIRAMHDSGVKQTEIARKFGVGPTAISKIIVGRRWKQVLS